MTRGSATSPAHRVNQKLPVENAPAAQLGRLLKRAPLRGAAKRGSIVFSVPLGTFLRLSVLKHFAFQFEICTLHFAICIAINNCNK